MALLSRGQRLWLIFPGSSTAIALFLTNLYCLRKMMGCRRRLLGDGTAGVEVLDPSEQRLLEAVLVIDEFCKELAAVTFVKYHHFSST